MNELEKAVTDEFGFDSMEEFNRMVTSVDITSRGKMLAFKDWQTQDGTKDGLTALLDLCIFCTDCDKRLEPEQINAWNREGMFPLCPTCGEDCQKGMKAAGY